jgi:hypothetical protein
MPQLLPTDINSDEFKKYADLVRSDKTCNERLSDYEVWLCCMAYNKDVEEKKMTGSQKRRKLKYRTSPTAPIKRIETQEEIDFWCKENPIEICCDREEVERNAKRAKLAFERLTASNKNNDDNQTVPVNE